MRLKLFRAPTVAAAMAQVRAELGADALILATRRVGTGIELTAALEPAAPVCSPADPAQLEGLRWHGVPPPLAAQLGHGDPTAALVRHFRFARLDLTHGSLPILLAGPPGAGKTLTTARLATRLVLQGASPLVISADGDRAGAAEQLAAFTRLLGLVLIVAPDPVGIARALARREAGAPVLIDAPGIDPFSATAQAGIATLAGAAGARIALVLPAGQDPAEAADSAAAFAAAGATALIATKLDVTRRMGGILAAAASLPLAEAGIGPGAADGLVPFTPDLLAARLAVPTTRKAA